MPVAVTALLPGTDMVRMARMSCTPTCLIDGQPAAALPLDDRGLAYGDGLFETLAVLDGRPRQWARHWARLCIGCECLGLAPPDEGPWRAETEALCAAHPRAVLKLIYTRGSGGRGYAPVLPARPRRITCIHPWPQRPAHWWTQGAELRLCRQRLGWQPALAGIKHLNRLEQVLARAEWDDPTLAEGLMFDLEDRLIAATAANVFLVRDETLLSPRLDRCGIAGCMREQVLEAAQRLDIPVVLRPLGLADLLAAEEVFLSNSLWPLLPVRAIRDLDTPALGPAPGPLSELLAGEVSL